MIVTIVGIYIPFFNPIFGTAPLNMIEFILIILISSIGFIYLELYKYLKSRNIEIKA